MPLFRPFLVFMLTALSALVVAASAAGKSSPPEAPTPLGAASEVEPALQAAIERTLYAIEPVVSSARDDATYHAANRSQRLAARFRPDAFEVEGGSGEAAWSWGLSLRQMGRDDALVPVPEATLVAEGSRIEYRRGNLVEWYLNAPRGIEQGFTLDMRPAGEGPLVLELALLGGLHPAVLVPDAEVAFSRTEGGEALMAYGHLVAWDATGEVVPARMELAALDTGEHGLRLVVDDAAALYPLTIDPLVVASEVKLTASDGAVGDYFGISVAVAGNLAVIGAFSDDVGANPGQGSAYVYRYDGASWVEEQKLTASDGAANDSFGAAVSISGELVVVGAPSHDVGANSDQGSVYVYRYDGVSWAEEQKLTAGDGAADDFFGGAVSVSGTVALVGAVGQDVGGNAMQGSAYVYRYNGLSWVEEQQLTASDGAANDLFGTTVSVAGNAAVIGAVWNDLGANADQGSAYVYRDNGASWVEEQQLTASDGAAGDQFGNSVSISGDVIVVGAPLDDVGANADQGSAYIYHDNGASWVEEQKLTASDGEANDQLGSSVGISDDVAVVGANQDDVFTNDDQGSAYVYRNSGASWVEERKLFASGGRSNDEFGGSVAIAGDVAVAGALFAGSEGAAYVFSLVDETKLTASNGAASDLFGISVALAGDLALVGAGGDDVGANANQGSAYVYRHEGTSWTEEQQLIAGDGSADDFFGAAVSISGNLALVGAVGQDVGGNTGQGSAYVYRYNGLSWVEEQQLTASDGAANDQFGTSLAIAGEIALVGALLHDVGANAFQGSAYVYRYNGVSWVEEQQLTASDGAANDFFGFAVSVAGDAAVVGAAFDDVDANADQGSAYVYRDNGASWVEEQQLTASDGVAGDQFGNSVSISGDVIVVGAQLDDVGAKADQGSAYLYRHNGASWVEEQQLAAADGAAGDNFGSSVAISNDLAVVGAAFDDVGGNTDQGSAYAYRYDGGFWAQEPRLVASDGAGTDRLGGSVAILGDVALLGAAFNGGKGAAYVFALTPRSLILVEGTAQGGTVALTIAGVDVATVATANGESDATVAAHIAAAISADATLSALGITAYASGNTVFIVGVEQGSVSFYTTDPGLVLSIPGEAPPSVIPSLSLPGLTLLALALVAAGRRGKPQRSIACAPIRSDE